MSASSKTPESLKATSGSSSERWLLPICRDLVSDNDKMWQIKDYVQRLVEKRQKL